METSKSSPFSPEEIILHSIDVLDEQIRKLEDERYQFYLALAAVRAKRSLTAVSPDEAMNQAPEPLLTPGAEGQNLPG